MNKKPMFADNEQETWTQEAHDLFTHINTAIRPIVQDTARRGYSLRHIQLVLESAVNEVVLDELLSR